MLNLKKLLKNPVFMLMLGIAIGILLTFSMFYTPGLRERFTQYSPSTEEVVKIPFYDRLAATEDMSNVDTKRIVIKAAYIAAKDNHELKEKLKSLMVKRINESLNTDEAVERLKRNYDRKLVNDTLKEAKIAAEKGAKKAVAEANVMVTQPVNTVTPTPEPIVSVDETPRVPRGPRPKQAPLPF